MRRCGKFSVQAVLVVVLCVALGALGLDMRGRSMSASANERMAAVDREQPLNPTDIEEVMQRKASSARQVSGGRIDTYSYTSGLPGRSYAIYVGFAEEAEQQFKYVDYSYQDASGALHLEQVIAAAKYRRENPPIEILNEPAELGVGETYVGVQNGMKLILKFDAETSLISGTVENTTRDPVTGATLRVELSDGTELGPITFGEIESGSRESVELPVEGDVESWTALADGPAAG